jgi:hypothetical protein
MAGTVGRTAVEEVSLAVLFGHVVSSIGDRVLDATASAGQRCQDDMGSVEEEGGCGNGNDVAVLAGELNGERHCE